ncbi:TetR/AcrR family transcriptional regulator [Paraliomyxa miuraensis]|uniref:TetR/AcrR family transcriptional regulator n=1 Tax=Paraliomyxa miuraensis TaxID=376150 RepID=UPI00224FD1F6|nr:TetR/AcrR family transcriptional regulator [Paraliomyxa miuraensis]MCX4244332.1 TetR/AcrR family transcriptional regulator [Paraliomyxa miuraensis]
MPKLISDDRILDAAVATVAEHGFAGATTRQIATVAEVNEVTLFRKFGTKANLLREAMVRELAAFEDAGGARYSGDVHADLRRVVELYRGLVERRGRLIPVLLAELPRWPELREVVEIPQRVIASVAVVLARYQQEGVLEPEPPLLAVASLLAPLMVLELVRGTNEALSPPVLVVEDHVRRFIAGRTPAQGSGSSSPKPKPRRQSRR